MRVSASACIHDHQRVKLNSIVPRMSFYNGFVLHRTGTTANFIVKLQA